MAEIHPTAIVAESAVLGKGVRIGPFSTVGPNVTLEDGVELVSHAIVDGHTHIGARTRLFPFASAGLAPQDLKYKGEPSRLVVGSDTVVREHATLHLGTEGGGMETRVGNRCLLMVGVHIAHDCKVGDNVILANNATLAGHVEIGDHVILGGLSAVHQWVRIGDHAFVGGMSGVTADLIPFGMLTGNRGRLNGLNLVGLRRAGYPREDIHTLRAAYRFLFAGNDPLKARIERLEAEYAGTGLVDRLIAFLKAGSDREISTPLAAGEGPEE
ncbi:Acyl-[acyl-carrier-protein]-UDP-N-acetylglucosamine O-acyltransferase [Hartmannibacter diazotrophicus]|uniref:Acyl-[acyl-carrier-protein]--UDP-N-acetylglucosamine O-acyltransferase n=1 Tax=Hartmannibacter diazotrophicus TaxID=1482074 RepID=A0A2C9D3U9_9HYPH|nr:acyl-ACP--UDP-N-acetylglucosamine O-acyltransferase [Hartmannibacter diazotrophicus]SON54946.1 Acyl-[acyl-carrier-protein]-UDP-N-acetylglucosamine O-acyltransferase [Hartmannibacter diazotrophicus]